MGTNKPSSSNSNPYFMTLHLRTDQKVTLSKHDFQVSGDSSIADIEYQTAQFIQNIATLTGHNQNTNNPKENPSAKDRNAVTNAVTDSGIIHSIKKHSMVFARFIFIPFTLKKVLILTLISGLMLTCGPVGIILAYQVYKGTITIPTPKAIDLWGLKMEF